MSWSPPHTAPQSPSFVMSRKRVCLEVTPGWPPWWVLYEESSLKPVPATQARLRAGAASAQRQDTCPDSVNSLHTPAGKGLPKGEGLPRKGSPQSCPKQSTDLSDQDCPPCSPHRRAGLGLTRGHSEDTRKASLAVQGLRHHASTVGGAGSIPGPETKIPQAAQSGQSRKIKIRRRGE